MEQAKMDDMHPLTQIHEGIDLHEARHKIIGGDIYRQMQEHGWEM